MSDMPVCLRSDQLSLRDPLQELCFAPGVLTALLITRQGTVIAEAGDLNHLNATAVAALVAGMFSATREVARMVGESQFSILLQQGERRHIHISLVSDDAMMVVVFEDHRRIGVVRHEARKAGELIVAIMTNSRDRERLGADLSVPQFKEYALNLIDRIFQP